MAEPHVNWKVGPEDAEWNASQAVKLNKAARKALDHFEVVAGRPLRDGPRADEEGDVADARRMAVEAQLARARYWRLLDNPASQHVADIHEADAWRWHGSAEKMKAHGARQAAYWVRRIFEMFGPFGKEWIPGREIAHEALRMIIRHCTVCPSCEAISYHSDPPKGREQKCDTCRRWDRRLKPYPGLRTRWDFAAVLRKQGGQCALCTESDPPVPEGALDGWHIDHDHLTGEVRGILCPSCNAKVGKHEADRDARGAIEDYLNG